VSEKGPSLVSRADGIWLRSGLHFVLVALMQGSIVWIQSVEDVEPVYSFVGGDSATCGHCRMGNSLAVERVKIDDVTPLFRGSPLQPIDSTEIHHPTQYLVQNPKHQHLSTYAPDIL
jgi:hypothetical protein